MLHPAVAFRLIAARHATFPGMVRRHLSTPLSIVFVAAALAWVSESGSQDAAPRMGSYVSSRIDDKKPPVRDLATDDRGTQYLIEFDELVLTLRATGEFRAALRYRQTLARAGEQTTQEPLQRMTVHGSWFREGPTLRFVPDPKRGGEGLRILNGTFTARTVSVPFDYRNGRVSRRSTVLLVFDPSII